MERASLRSLAILGACTLGGCFTNLDGVKVDRDGGEGEVDLRGGGGGGGECKKPYLAVAVRDIRSTSGLVRHGTVLRLPLDGRTCTPLTLADSLAPDPIAIGFWPPTTVVYGEADGRVRFLAPDDTEAQAPYDPGSTQSPDYFFAIQEGSETRLAIAYDNTNDPLSPSIARIDVLDATNLSSRVARWELGVSDATELIRAEGVVAIDTDPRDPHRFLVFRNRSPDDPTQAFVPPWDDQPALPMDYLTTQSPDDFPAVLRTLSRNGAARLAWVYTPSSFSSGGSRVVHRSEKSGSAPKQWGPLACTNATQCTEPLSISDAIPDFSDDDSVLATCYVDHSDVTGASTSNIIRIRSNGTCDTIFRGDALIESQQLIAVAAAL